jgi:chitin disaccharide deacetylase
VTTHPAYLVVNADDFGMTEGTNRAIIDAHQKGIVTSTSLLANGQSFDHAVELAKANPTLGVGVHLTLSEGRPIDDMARMIVFVPGVEAGHFPLGNSPYVKALLTNKLPHKNIMREFKSQILKITRTGIKPTHIDGHKYIHLLPRIADIVAEVADVYGIPFVRLPRPADSIGSMLGKPTRVPGMLALAGMSALAYPLVKRAERRIANRFVGFSDTGRLTLDKLRSLLRKPRAGITEVVCHPAYRSAQLQSLLSKGYEWIEGYNFEEETAAVTSADLRRELEAAGWKLVNFGQISE